ncbi:septum site-determining protein MinC [Bacterioplanes sanyensis]|uniref:Probable septum site-determining protein MinC n=1 Tax=Bacterioplanes sanyensis TaxID=1249553 RepID=A0A222FQG9_9GAMM|nr:septum site-determining protein MinC [Bacterioplanes sanyensis]ASP40756.1 septum site-determining protein MinC [Bacterioplanes sanyensis]
MKEAAVSLKAGTVSLTTLTFSNWSPEAIEAELQRKQAEAPALFQQLPCAIDIDGLPTDHPLATVVSLCRRYGLLPIAVRNASRDWAAPLAELGLADLGRQAVKSSPKAGPSLPVKLHRGNVRSGQQVFAEGDLIIIGMVSAGAEILAGGDIHIYGTLRGRALAGVKGDQLAVIACQQFDAELVAIAGQYRLFDEQPLSSSSAVVVTLQDGNLNIHSV